MSTRRKTYVLRRPEQLGALGSPVRCRIAEALSAHGPSTVRQLAARLERKPESLYYHVQALIDVGLVVHHSNRKVNRRSEAVYRLIAPRLIVDRKQTSRAYKEAICRSCDTLLRLAGRDHHAGVERGDLTLEGPLRSLMIRRCSSRLTKGGLAKVNRLLDRVVALFAEQDDAESSDTYAVTMVLSRISADTER